MKYRLVFAHTGEPDSDWSEDAEHFHRYIAERPDGVSKLIVMDEEGNEVKPATAEDELLEGVDFLPDRRPHYQLVSVFLDATEFSGWTWDLTGMLRYRDRLQDLPYVQALFIIIDEQGNVVEADGIERPPDWLPQALDEYEQRFEEAADAADKTEQK